MNLNSPKMKSITFLLLFWTIFSPDAGSQPLVADCDTTEYSDCSFMDLLDLDDPKLLELAYSIVDPALVFPTDDDTDIRKTLPMIFEETGYPHFLEMMRRLTNGEMKGEFYLDSYVPMEIPDGYYEDLLAYHSTCDSIKQRFPAYNDIGDLRENYIFYKQGKADRIIQLTFLKGIQLIAWDDEYLLFNK